MNWLKIKDTCGAIMCAIDFYDLICKSSVPGPLLLSRFRLFSSISLSVIFLN